MRIYYSQYGFLWSTTLETAIEIASLAIAGKTWDWDKVARPLKRKYCSHAETCNCIAKPNHFISLDWEIDDWKDHLEQLLELKNRSKHG